MSESVFVEKLFDEALLLSVEDRTRLTDLLIGQCQKDIEESTVYKIEELGDGSLSKYYRVRPEDRRRKDGKRFDLFMGLLTFSYSPPATANAIKQQLEQWAGFSRQKDPERKIYMAKIIEEMATELFWNLPDMYQEMTRTAENDLLHKIESSFLKKIGIKLETISYEGGRQVIKTTHREIVQKKIYNKKPQRPKGTPTFDEDDFFDDLESTILRVAAELQRDDLKYEQVVLCELLSDTAKYSGRIQIPG